MRFPLPIVGLALAAVCMLDVRADAGDLKSALTDESTVTVHFRSYFFDRDKPGDDDSEAWAAGGWVGYQTGWIADVLRFGLVGYTSQPLYAPEDKPGSDLLLPDQSGFFALGQAYASLRLAGQTVTGGWQLVDQPQVNPDDSRMVPNTFEGVMATGSVSGLDYALGFLTGMKPRDSTIYSNPADIAGVDDVWRPMLIAGIDYRASEALDGRFSVYLVPDVLLSPYGDLTWRVPLGGGVEVALGTQAMVQSSVGDDLLTGSSFDTWVGGLRADLTWDWLTLTAAVTQTGDGADYESPYGTWPGYTHMQIQDFDEAGQTAWLARAAVDFGAFGLAGLKADVAAVVGNGAIDPTTGDGVGDQLEIDLSAEYAFADLDVADWLKPLTLRAEAARLRAEDGGTTAFTNELRAIVNYEVRFPAK